jgi:hypothetical protein
MEGDSYFWPEKVAEDVRRGPKKRDYSYFWLGNSDECVQSLESVLMGE